MANGGRNAAKATLERLEIGMVSLRGTDVVDVNFDSALGQLKTVPEHRYYEAAVLLR